MRVEVRDEHSGGSSDVVLFGAVDLQTSFPAMFACRYPVQLAGTGGSTSPALAIAVSAAGGLGVLSGTCSAQVLRAPLDEIPPDLSVGVNFLVRFLDRVSLEHAAARAEDTVVTTAFGDSWPDAPHRVLRSSVAAATALGDTQAWTPDWPTDDDEGVAEARALYAGESVGAVRSRQPTADIIIGLVAEARAELERRTAPPSA